MDAIMARMHVLTFCRLATNKAQDKLQTLIDSTELEELTIVRHRPVPLHTDRKRLNQVNYLMGFPDNVHEFTPLMRIQNHIMMLWAGWRAVRHYNPHLIYGIFLVPYGLLAWVFSKLYRKPCLISLVGTDLNDYTLRLFTAPFFQWVLRHTDWITVVDEDAYQRLVATGVPAQRVFVLPNSVDLRPYKALWETAPPKTAAAIYTGRLLDYKEPQNLIYTWAHVVETKPDAKLLIVGDGAMREDLEALAAEMGLDENIVFVGWVENVPAYVGRAHIFLSLSSQEGTPTALLEAMTAGLVPVHTRVGGVPTVIRHKHNGILVDYPTDVQVAASHIIRLLDDSAYYERLSHNAKAIHERFSLAGVTAVWDAILETVRE